MSYQKFTKNIGILALTQIVMALGGIIVLPVITKILGAEKYGVWTELVVAVGIIGPLAILGLPYTLVRFLSGEKDKKEIQDGVWSVFTIIFVISIIISSALMYFSGLIAHFFGAEKIFVQILAFIIIFDFLNMVFSNVFRTFQQVKESCFFTIFQELVETGLIVLAIFLGYGLLGAVLSLLIARIVNFLIMGTLVVKKVGLKIPKFWKMKQYLSFGLPNVLSEISGWIIQSSDRYLIGFFMGALFVGYYAPAYTLGCYTYFFTGPLVYILPAVLSKHYDENKMDEVKKYLKYSLKYFLLLSIPAFFGLSILSKKFLTYLSTPEIAQHSYFVVPFVALSMLLLGVYAIISDIINLKKKTHINGAIWLIAAILNLGLNFIFVPRLGILGAAITTLLAFLFVFVSACYFSYREINFDVDWKSILKSFFASALMAVFILWFNPTNFAKTMIAIPLGALVYFVLIFLFRSFGEGEKEFIKKFLRDIRKIPADVI